MGAEVAALCERITGPKGSGQGDTIPHEGVKDRALLYKGAELAHL